MTRSLLTTSTFALPEMSLAVTTPSLLTERNTVSGPLEKSFTRSFLRFRRTFITSSLTPGSAWYSCVAFSMRTAVTAAPSRLDSSTRRSALPTVWP